MQNILLIEENNSWRQRIQETLKRSCRIQFWPNGKKLTARLAHENFDIVVLDVQPECSEHFKRLNEIRQISPYTPVIAMSEHEEASLIVKTIKAGAFDFLTKPFSGEAILLSIERALENRKLKNEVDYLRHEQNVIYDFKRIIANSPGMRQVIDELQKFALTDSTVLVTGETGTGKSFLSGAIHFNSKRRDKPFIKINCANIPDMLLESELFGHESGAFTGADRARIGRLEQARGGTVFLDEIGEMSMSLQAKLLRVLEDRTFERVGGNRTIFSDVRIIAATNKKLEELIEDGNFRKDLFFRINVLRQHLPPLRERKECIEPLSYYFLKKLNRNLKKKIYDFSTPAIIDDFKNYSWPGNIRQLTNTIERAMILEDSEKITPENIFLPDPVRKRENRVLKSAPKMLSLRIREKEMILHALNESAWIQKDAASKLNISPRALNYKIKKFGITHPNWRKNR